MSATRANAPRRANGGLSPLGTGKLAAAVARRMHKDIVELGWPVGSVLGAEHELLERYGVSRAVYREAARIIEHLGAGRVRRGPGGGLVISAPKVAMVTEAVTVYLLFARITQEELFDARRAIEDRVVELATTRAHEEDIARLRGQIEDEERAPSLGVQRHHRLHTLLAEVTRNPAAELFIDTLGRLASQYAYGAADAGSRRNRDDSLLAHRRIVDAVVSGDSGLARHRMDAHLEAMESSVRRRRQASTLQPEDLATNSGEGSKLAEVVARKLLQEVLRRGWPVGEVLGSEADLMATYDVSRAALREAVRLLEHHQIAAMRRGPGGGLVVTAPDAGAVTSAAAMYLDYRGIQPVQLIEIRRGLELYAVERAAERIDAAGAERLEEELEQEIDEGEDSTHDNLHLALADLAGNRAVWLFTNVLTQLTWEHTRHLRTAMSTRTRRQATQAAIDAHRWIIDAVVAGDAHLARRRMQAHLEALEPFLH